MTIFEPSAGGVPAGPYQLGLQEARLIIRREGAEALHEPEEWGRLFALAIIQHAAGRRTEADEALQGLARKYANDAAYQLAEAYAVRGAADLAFEWLERAYAQRDAGIAWTKIDPLLRTLHADPRWEVFLRKLGLAD